MNLKSLIIISCLSVVATSCYTREQIVESNQLERIRHHNICIERGYIEGNLEYTHCMERMVYNSPHYYPRNERLVRDIETERVRDLEIKDGLFRERVIKRY